MNPFMDKVIKCEYVGSRVTCKPPPNDTDEDVLVLTDNIKELIHDCDGVGFEINFGDYKLVNFTSLRKGYINLIVTDEEEFYEKFLLATHVCKSLNVLDKEDRITIFQAILYGKKYCVPHST